MHVLLIPPWFYGFDSVMYLVSAVVGLLISLNLYRLHSIIKKKSHYFMHVGFMLLSVGLLLAFIVSLFSYIQLRFCHTVCQLGLLDVTFGIEDFGFFLYFVLSIIGYSLLALAYFPEKNRIPVYILMLGLLLSAIVVFVGTPRPEILLWYTYNQYFHLLSLLILSFVLFRVFINSLNSKTSDSFLVTAGFFGIAAFHVFQFFAYLSPWTYVFAHIFLIAGYLSFLSMLIKVKR